MKKSFLFLSISILLLIIPFSGYKVFKDPSLINEMKHLIKVKLGKDKKRNIWALKIKEEIDILKISNQDNLIEHLRNFINVNSCHREGTAYHKTRAFLIDSVMKDIYLYSKDTNNVYPELSCSPRSWALQELLKCFNIPSRIVMLYVSQQGNISSHTMVEAYNKQLHYWQVHDADLNVHFVDSISNNRLSIMAIKSKNDYNFYPCRFDTCSWKNTYYDYRNPLAFSILRYYFFDDVYKQDQIFVNLSSYPNKIDRTSIHNLFKDEEVFYY
jgi:hypothetical protein